VIYLAFALVAFSLTAHIVLVDRQYQRTRRELRELKAGLRAGRETDKVVPGSEIPIVTSNAVPPGQAFLMSPSAFDDFVHIPRVKNPYAALKITGLADPQ
jgi:hypothetical protein